MANNIFLCNGCSDMCTVRTRVSTQISNATFSICPCGKVPKFIFIKKEDMEPLIRRIPPSVCTLCDPHKTFVDIQEFLVHIISHAPDNSYYSVPFTRVVYGRIPKKEKENIK